MTAGLFLAPATPRNGAYQFFETTVLDGVPQRFYQDYTDTDHGDPARIWGLTETMQKSWEQINSGDWVLFYVAENEYRYAFRVSGKENNPELGDAIRNDLLNVDSDRGDRDWTYLVFFEDPVHISATGESVADLFDYGNDFPVRFIRVTEERIQALDEEYETVEKFVDSLRTDP